MGCTQSKPDELETVNFLYISELEYLTREMIMKEQKNMLRDIKRHGLVSNQI
jgi:hypothetical protein